MDDNNNNMIKKRCRGEAEEEEVTTTTIKRLKENLLSSFEELLQEESDYDHQIISCTTKSSDDQHDLDFFMKSFQDEIGHDHQDVDSSSTAAGPEELGYLLEASDDELGIPPPSATTNSSPVINSHDDQFERVESNESLLNDVVEGSDYFWEINNYNNTNSSTCFDHQYYSFGFDQDQEELFHDDQYYYSADDHLSFGLLSSLRITL